MSEPVVIYTDGACRGNPGPGGWGALLRHGENTRELCGGEANTTKRIAANAIMVDARIVQHDLGRAVCP